MSGHFEYAFLLDECVMHLVTLFPKGRAKTIGDSRKRGAADPQVVDLAHADGRIIVTNNSRDYRSEMKTFAKRWGNDRCSDLSGLHILPNDVLDQKRVLDLPKLERRIKRRWADVAQDNLLVQVDRDGKVTVEQLPRCGYCERLAVSSS